jgi:uncharacterized protein (TIGR00251 family)
VIAPSTPLWRSYSGAVADLFDISGSDGSPSVVLRVVAHPGAGRTSVVGKHGDALRVRVGAPPVGGRANEALVALVAEIFGVTRDRVEITGGESSRSKRVKVLGVGPDEARRHLEEALGQGGRGPARPGGPAPLQRRL